jgi:hypothetical protein
MGVGMMCLKMRSFASIIIVIGLHKQNANDDKA